MKYTVVTSNDLGKFIQWVNRFIEQGWLPIGGIYACPTVYNDTHDCGRHDLDIHYFQAMMHA